jgi:hypothetical protein
MCNDIHITTAYILNYIVHESLISISFKLFLLIPAWAWIWMLQVQSHAYYSRSCQPRFMIMKPTWSCNPPLLLKSSTRLGVSRNSCHQGNFVHPYHFILEDKFASWARIKTVMTRDKLLSFNDRVLSDSACLRMVNMMRWIVFSVAIVMLWPEPR